MQEQVVLNRPRVQLSVRPSVRLRKRRRYGRRGVTQLCQTCSICRDDTGSAAEEVEEKKEEEREGSRVSSFCGVLHLEDFMSSLSKTVQGLWFGAVFFFFAI